MDDEEWKQLLLHRVGSLLHFLRGLFHFIGESFLFWLSDRALLHPFVAFHLSGVFLLFSALHLHALVLHPLHTAVLHAGHVLHVVLHFFCAFGIRRGRAQFSLDGDCRFILHQKIARRSRSAVHVWIGWIIRGQWRRIRRAAS